MLSLSDCYVPRDGISNSRCHYPPHRIILRTISSQNSTMALTIAKCDLPSTSYFQELEFSPANKNSNSILSLNILLILRTDLSFFRGKAFQEINILHL